MTPKERKECAAKYRKTQAYRDLSGWRNNG